MELKKCIEKLMRREDLDDQTCKEALELLLDENNNPLQKAAFLVLLRSKPETITELVSIIQTLRQKIVPIVTQYPVLDIVGTGGDGANTINISTGSAILAASCGVKIAKHGNRAVSSLSGAADVLEALGVEINLPAEKIAACIDTLGIGFCFAPNFLPVLRQLRGLRKELNVATTLNILGPLLNPANASYYVLGVLDEKLLMPIAQVLQKTGSKKSLVVHGCGLDEISCVGPAKVLEVTPETIKEFSLQPQAYQLPLCQVSDLRGGDANVNAQLLKNALIGKHEAITNTFILNAAAAMWIYGTHTTIAEAIEHAKENIFNHRALTLLTHWAEFTHAYV
jgi:anthranilate phosphoribosyltransferase